MISTKQLRNQNLYATIVTQRDWFEEKKRFVKYIIELKPGIFISIILSPNNLFYNGDFIEIRKENKEINFHLLISSDERFFNRTKFAAILPKNNITDFKLNEASPYELKEQLVNKKYYISANFSNIELSLVPNCSSEKILPFLKKENKICLIANKKVRPDIPSSFKYAAKLVFAHKKNKKVYLNDPDGNETGITLYPEAISFQEISYNSLLEILNRVKWNYSDKKTLVWNEEDTNWVPRNISKLNYFKTPIPVYYKDKQYTLRYPIFQQKFGQYITDINDLSKISLPTNILLIYLRELSNHKKSRYTFTVVCCDNDSVWIELSPGRIVEVNSYFLKIKNTKHCLCALLVEGRLRNAGV